MWVSAARKGEEGTLIIRIKKNKEAFKREVWQPKTTTSRLPSGSNKKEASLSEKGGRNLVIGVGVRVKESGYRRSLESRGSRHKSRELRKSTKKIGRI